MITINKQSLQKWQDDNLERLRYEYDLKPTDYVIDIGSYQREWANEITRRYGCEVECFDALDNRAAWKFDGVLSMGGAFYYTSMFDDKGKQDFKCVDIAPYLEKEVALLKMNIEGGEYELLEYIISKGLINNIKNLQVQFHEIENNDMWLMYMTIYWKLMETHEITWRYPFCWENWLRDED